MSDVNEPQYVCPVCNTAYDVQTAAAMSFTCHDMKLERSVLVRRARPGQLVDGLRQHPLRLAARRREAADTPLKGVLGTDVRSVGLDGPLVLSGHGAILLSCR